MLCFFLYHQTYWSIIYLQRSRFPTHFLQIHCIGLIGPRLCTFWAWAPNCDPTNYIVMYYETIILCLCLCWQLVNAKCQINTYLEFHNDFFIIIFFLYFNPLTLSSVPTLTPHLTIVLIPHLPHYFSYLYMNFSNFLFIKILELIV